MLALDSVEGPKHCWAWFSEGSAEEGLVLGTSK
jgi:hypothetical protein